MDMPNATRPLSRRLGLVAVLATAAALRLWRLDQNGFGNESRPKLERVSGAAGRLVVSAL